MDNIDASRRAYHSGIREVSILIGPNALITQIGLDLWSETWGYTKLELI